jgi:hypothetical protein
MLGGVSATIVLTALMYIGIGSGLLKFSIPDIVARTMAFGEFLPGNSAMIAWGIVVYAIFTLFFCPLCYAYWVYSYMPGAPWARGLTFGIGLWFLMQIFLMPMIGQGVFNFHDPNPAIEIVSQFVLWSVYGIVLGVVAGPQEVWRDTPQHQRPAPLT